MIQIKTMKTALVIILILIFSVISFTYAETEMQFLLGESKLVQNLKNANSLSDIFNVLFQTVIALGAIWAVASLAYWGAKYALWDSVTGKKAALDHMTPILTGLVALLGTYILFKQINPEIINSLDLKVDENTIVQMQDVRNKAFIARDIANTSSLNEYQKRDMELKKGKQQTKNRKKTASDALGVDLNKYKIEQQEKTESGGNATINGVTRQEFINEYNEYKDKNGYLQWNRLKQCISAGINCDKVSKKDFEIIDRLSQNKQ